MVNILPVPHTPPSYALGESELFTSYLSRTNTNVVPVTLLQCPSLALFFFAVGGLSVARFALKTLFVLFQTFVVSGKSVRVRLRGATAKY